MTTVLQYLVIAAVIGLVVFALAVVVFGRGEQLAPLSPRSSPTELPDRGIAADDVRKMRFAMSLRGYRMSDVDWAMERMAGEIGRLRAVITGLGGDPDPAPQAPGDAVSNAPARPNPWPAGHGIGPALPQTPPPPSGIPDGTRT